MNGSSTSETGAYKGAGVDIDAGNLAVEKMKPAIRATFTPSVLADVGAFGGLFALDDIPAQPVLVASTDGVGTKVKLAAHFERWDGIGHDIVNHCVNDILVQNARPLFFLDYIAAAKLNPQSIAAVVIGIAEACRAVGCALLGGETAEMPGVYVEGAFDLVGTVVGVVDRNHIWPLTDIMQAGDMLIGLPSSGPHTNGYSLIRKAIQEIDLEAIEVGGVPLVDALLAPHRCYVPGVEQLRTHEIGVRGLGHITGGGFIDNIPRILPDNLTALIDSNAWTVPPLFEHLIEWAGMTRGEAFRVFNMGIGMVAVVAAEDVERIQAVLPDAILIGRLVERPFGQPPIQLG